MCPSTEIEKNSDEFAASVLRNLLAHITEQRAEGNDIVLVSHAWTDGPVMYLVYEAPPSNITWGLVRDTRESSSTTHRGHLSRLPYGTTTCWTFAKAVCPQHSHTRKTISISLSGTAITPTAMTLANDSHSVWATSPSRIATSNRRCRLSPRARPIRLSNPVAMPIRADPRRQGHTMRVHKEGSAPHALA